MLPKCLTLVLLYFRHVDWIVGNSFGAGAGIDGCIDVDFGSDGDDVAVDVAVCVAVGFVVLVVDIVGFDFVDTHCCYLVHIC